jgi:hypothetical protein
MTMKTLFKKVCVMSLAAILTACAAGATKKENARVRNYDAYLSVTGSTRQKSVIEKLVAELKARDRVEQDLRGQIARLEDRIAGMEKSHPQGGTVVSKKIWKEGVRTMNAEPAPESAPAPSKPKGKTVASSQNKGAVRYWGGNPGAGIDDQDTAGEPEDGSLVLFEKNLRRLHEGRNLPAEDEPASRSVMIGRSEDDMRPVAVHAASEPPSRQDLPEPEKAKRYVVFLEFTRLTDLITFDKILQEQGVEDRYQAYGNNSYRLYLGTYRQAKNARQRRVEIESKGGLRPTIEEKES